MMATDNRVNLIVAAFKRIYADQLTHGVYYVFNNKDTEKLFLACVGFEQGRLTGYTAGYNDAMKDKKFTL